MRYLTIQWDDGLLRSCLKIAEIYEKHGLRTEFIVNIVNDFPENVPGDFDLWNELQQRGHFVHPHGYNHFNLAVIPYAEAQQQVLRCLDVFTEKLQGFDPSQAIFGFPYSASTPEIEEWLPSVVRAFRTGNGNPINPLPSPETVKLLVTSSEQAEECLESYLSELMTKPEGWLIFAGHGLDGEGWGPIGSDYLDRFLAQIVEEGELTVLPAKTFLTPASLQV